MEELKKRINLGTELMLKLLTQIVLLILQECIQMMQEMFIFMTTKPIITIRIIINCTGVNRFLINGAQTWHFIIQKGKDITKIIKKMNLLKVMDQLSQQKQLRMTMEI